MIGVASRLTSRRGLVRATGFAGLFLAYLALVKLGLIWAVLNQAISPIYPASGLAIGALALWGPSLWPVVFLGESIAVYLFGGIPVAVAIGMGVGSALEAVLGALVLRHLGVVGEVARVRDALVIVLVAMVAPIPAASSGVLGLTLAGLSSWSHYAALWQVWWIGDSAGALVALPLLLAWAGRRAANDLPARPLEFAGALILVVAALYAARLYSITLARFGIEYMPVTTFLSVPLVWAVLRLRPREAVTVMAEAATLAAFWTLTITPQQLLGALLWLPVILLSICSVSLLLVGALSERRAALLALEAAKVAEKAKAVAEAARKEAERANIAKSKFLAAASHDLRQPTQSLMLLTETLSIKLEGRPEAAIATHIAHATNALKDMLDSLLDLSRLDAGVIAARPESFALGAWMTQLEDESTVRAQSKGLPLKFVQSSCWVRSDPRLLAGILRNLIDNAIKFTPSGKVLIGCRPSASSVRLEVHDTGVGIAPEHLEMIFEEFHQVGNPERDRRKGLGLGLCTVKRLSLLLDHPVTVRSRPSNGSCFCLTVPRVPPQIVPREAPVVATGRGLVVVVDDDEMVRTALKIQLGDWGYEVVATADDAETIERLNGRCPALVLSDYRLAGGLTGFDVMARLTAHLGKTVPGILLTGDTSPEHVRKASSAGYRLLHKPVSAHALGAALRKVA